MLDYTSSLAFAIENRRENPRLKTLFGTVRALSIDANGIFYLKMKRGTPIQVKLHTTFSDCSDSGVEMLYGVCYAVLSSIRKKEYTAIE